MSAMQSSEKPKPAPLRGGSACIWRYPPHIRERIGPPYQGGVGRARSPRDAAEPPFAGAKEDDVQSEVKKFDMAAVKQWLAKDVTIKLPGWALALGGVILLALILE